jgi:hypothetical protein
MKHSWDVDGLEQGRQSCQMALNYECVEGEDSCLSHK